MRDKRRAEGPAMLSFIGASGSGKTTLLVKLIAELSRRGLRVGAVKHSRRDFTLDIEGKDSDRFRKAGAGAVLLVSPRSIGLVADAPRGFSPRRAATVFFPGADIVLVEGWKDSGIPKVIVTGPASRAPRVRNVIVAVGAGGDYRVPRFDAGDIRGLADFVIEFIRSPRNNRPLKRAGGPSRRPFGTLWPYGARPPCSCG